MDRLLTLSEVKAEDSAKWRATSVELLNSGGVNQFDEEVKEAARKDFKALLENLKYEFKETKKAKDFEKYLDQALK